MWQFFSGMAHYEHRLPCDATQIGRFRRDLGEEGLELLLKATIETAVQEKAIAHPTDNRLLEIARHKVVSAAKRAGVGLKQRPLPKKAKPCAGRLAATPMPNSSGACAGWLNASALSWASSCARLSARCRSRNLHRGIPSGQ